ncbi:MAG: ATP-binding cassette domain-containing protein [Actinomycetota bacterium]
MAQVAIRDLVVEYSSGGYAVRPFDHYDLELESGEMVLLLGASGSGKSTLLSILGSLLTPTSGSVTVGDTEVTALGGRDLMRYRQRGVGFIFQGFNLIASLTARENVVLPMVTAGVSRRDARTRADELLTMVGLGERMHHRPGAMSGGQQQRVAIARALALAPPLIIADEPTASLDYIQVDAVIRHLRDLAAPGRTVVIATHDDRLIPLADRLVELTPRAVATERPPEPRTLGIDELLFRQGDPGDLVYEVDSGTVVIVRALTGGGEEILQVVEPGGYFGELAPLFGLARAATARGGPGGAVVTGYSVRDFRDRHGEALGRRGS